MTTKNAKDYLNQLRIADTAINSKLNEIEYWRAKSLQVSPQSESERVQSSGSGGDFTKIIDKIVTLQNQINEEIDKLFDAKTEARKLIQQLADERHKAVLTDYYICHLTWDEVAEKEKFTKRWVYRLHGFALIEFEKILNS